MLVLEGHEGLAREVREVEGHRVVLCELLAQQDLLVVDQLDLVEQVLVVGRLLVVLDELVAVGALLLLLCVGLLYVLLHQFLAHVPQDLHLGDVEAHGYARYLLTLRPLFLHHRQVFLLDLLEVFGLDIADLSQPLIQLPFDVVFDLVGVIEGDVVRVDALIKQQDRYILEEERVVVLRVLRAIDQILHPILHLPIKVEEDHGENDGDQVEHIHYVH